MRRALALARRGYGTTSPNPMVGAVLIKKGKVIGQGWHHRAGQPHAEIEALRQAQSRGLSPQGATLYITLEPCCTHGRTPPCTQAIIDAGIQHVVIGATDPNPAHRGKAYQILQRAGIGVTHGILQAACEQLNEAFNHWIVTGQPLVTVKAAMTLDGKIATAAGESKWITDAPAREVGLKLRRGSDAILVGVNTVLADNPSLTARALKGRASFETHQLRRIVLDTRARTPLNSKIVTDQQAEWTTVVVSKLAAAKRVAALARKVNVIEAPLVKGVAGPPQIQLRWLLKRLGVENVTSLLVEGGGEVNASFLLARLAQRVAFFYAPKILGGRKSRKAVAGQGILRVADAIRLTEAAWRRAGSDLVLTARIQS
jgi:diaminohydroxyphosphoribosylaminopyrimidine deaminase / 5-amino-6-(5-phosphoribosylamino)uracil reductase